MSEDARCGVRKREVERSNANSNALGVCFYSGITLPAICAWCHSDLFFKRGVEGRL